MNRGRVACPFAFWLTAMCLPALGASAADKAPEEVLKSKGLTKVGLCYVLDEDKNLSEWMRTTRAPEKKVEDSIRRRANLERDIQAAYATMRDLDEQNRAQTAKLEKMSKEAFGSYNYQVDKVNVIRAKLRDGLQFVEKRQKAMQEIGDPTDEYVAIVLKLSDMFESLSGKYEALAADNEVKSALDRINATEKAKVRLGPSERFKQELPGVRRLRETVNSATIKFDFVGGVPQVPVTLNGSVKVEMIVDSGAATVTLTSETAQKLGLNPGPTDRTIKLVSADGTETEAHVMTLKSVRLGKFTVENVECAVQPPSIKGAVDLLGGTFLRRFVYKMDLSAGVLKLSEITLHPADSQASGARSATTTPAAPGLPTAGARPPAKAPAAAPAVKIVSARWGGGNNWSDVTQKMIELVTAGGDIWANPTTLGADPTPGWRKHLEITYVKDGQQKTMRIDEDQQVHSSDLKP